MLPAFVLVAAGILFLQGTGRKAAFAALLLGPMLYALFVLGPQQSIVWRRPEMAKDDSMGKTLLAVHADLILRELAASGAGSDESVHALLRDEFAKAAVNPGPYVSLGFDPDYLMYTSPLFANVYQLGYSREQFQRLCLRWYLRSVVHQPGGFIRKWLRQFLFYFFPDPQIFVSVQIPTRP